MALDHDTLASGFGRSGEAYLRGRPSYPAKAVAWILDGLPPAPRVIDVGAGSGQLALPLTAAGARVLAIEPDPLQRALLERRVTELGAPVQVRDGRAEALGEDEASADLVTCGDSFHWFDPPRALAEFHRVLRPGGRLSVSMLRWGGWDMPWMREVGELIAEQFARTDHPLLGQGTSPLGQIGPQHGFSEPVRVDVPFEHHTDRDGLLALLCSISPVAALPDAERASVRGRFAALLAEHEVGELTLPFRAELRLARPVPK